MTKDEILSAACLVGFYGVGDVGLKALVIERQLVELQGIFAAYERERCAKALDAAGLPDAANVVRGLTHEVRQPGD